MLSRGGKYSGPFSLLCFLTSSEPGKLDVKLVIILNLISAPWLYKIN